ncbi:MAG: 50S ribosomal protein L31 [Chloroflexota bacterium]|nr:50S ribosomal protein L31 [Chloroflexota bacterium]
MKAAIHPKYQTATATCACGNTFSVGSTKANLKVDVCAKCHPFYTGQQRILDTAGRVERFRKRFNIAEEE